jgi:hypothetical protein
MPDFTTTTLLSDCKLYGAIPTGQPAFTDANLLKILTDELRSKLAPFIMSTREEYYVTYSDSTITSSTTSFDIPTRASGMILRDVKLVNNSDIESDLVRVNPAYQDLHYKGFYLRDNKVYLLNPGNYSDYSLRLFYYLRPSELKAVADCALISSVGSSSVVVSAVPSTWGSSETVDAVQANPPFGILGKDLTGTISGTTITLSSVPTGLAAGDYICLDQESPVPQLPQELHRLLVQAGLIRFAEILGDKDTRKEAIQTFDEMSKSLAGLITPRVVGEPKKTINYESFLSRPIKGIGNYWF